MVGGDCGVVGDGSGVAGGGSSVAGSGSSVAGVGSGMIGGGSDIKSEVQTETLPSSCHRNLLELLLLLLLTIH